jgi:uncharacterized protein (DUF736 family)
MAVIGTFTRAKDGGWEGTIRTLSFTAKTRFVPNDNRDGSSSPDFRVLSGTSELGAAWTRRGSAGEHREYLSVQLDDPAFARPITAALFYTADDPGANLVWRRDDARSQG